MALEGTIVIEVDSLFLSAKISGFSIFHPHGTCVLVPNIFLRCDHNLYAPKNLGVYEVVEGLCHEI